MKKDEKQKQAEALREELAKAKSVLLSGFEGITVAQDTDLRSKVAKVGAKYRVVKNSLIERASEGTPLESLAGKLRGTTSLAYTDSDPVGLAKIITAYAKENPVLVFKTGVVEGRVVLMADLSALASLPSRETLLSKVLYLIKSPAQGAASALAGVARSLAYVLQQGVQQNRFQGRGDREQGTETAASNSGAFWKVKRVVDRKLAVGGGRPEREQAAKGLAPSGGDPCDFDNILPTLGRADATTPGAPHSTVQELYTQLSDSEKEQIKSYYREECAKLRTEFPELFAQRPAGN